MEEFINRHKKELTWLFYAIAIVLVLLFLREQLADKKASRIVQTLITGTLVGGIYGLVALGIVVINKASGVFNFAHGWMMVVGGMIFWSFFTKADISVSGRGTSGYSHHADDHDNCQRPKLARAAQSADRGRRHPGLDAIDDYRRHRDEMAACVCGHLRRRHLDRPFS